MSHIKCKTCNKTQETQGLTESHLYCPRHTGDENEKGIGLVCLNLKSINFKTGQCPDCGLYITEYKNGRIRGYTFDKKDQIKIIFDW